MSTVPSQRTEMCACPSVEIHVVGDLDLAAAPRLRERLRDALTLRPVHLFVDLEECTFIDATGVAALLEAHRGARRQDASLVLRACGPHHLRIFALMGLRGVFDVEDVSG